MRAEFVGATCRCPGGSSPPVTRPCLEMNKGVGVRGVPLWTEVTVRRDFSDPNTEVDVLCIPLAELPAEL